MIDEENPLESTQGTPVDSSETPPGEISGENQVSPEGASEFQAGTGDSTVLGGDGSTQVESAATEGVDSQLEAVDYTAILIEKENEIRALKSQLDDRTNQCVRIAADFDNYRKRTQREREEQEVQIKCSTINELLPVVDNFERARSQIKPQTDQETNIHKSYQSVYKQLVECLKRIGVAPMRSEGKEFDPNLHEAVMRQPTDEYSEGTVIEELQRGYMLGDRVLRHALVKVAAAPEPVITSEEADQGG
ncbi:nucleotide exchange factor GrpE [Kovacikia minuta CCNUW1]|uniref:nucleotide exchange factor GrpE n=1 Tax=Kovacikia minuta TaxID=2931930 RepID=UPI001CCAD286|nr:nucleotide exchange factor GrpE [Kovacikia minuta]UBF25297.1 nucleotide exchange factor GrpE [Kovacikia minuta CCNUW1]